MKHLKHLLGRIIFGLRLHRLWLSQRAIVVAFHGINDEGKHAYNTGIKEFRRYCEFLSRHFEVVSLSELIDSMESSKVGGQAVITFDDGYKDNRENALPILQSLKLGGTFFVVTNEMEGATAEKSRSRLGSGDVRWLDWDDVRYMRQNGFEVGCHTMSHQNLGSVDEATAIEEISGSYKAYLTNMKKPPKHFAYPYGGPHNFSKATLEIVRKSGFSTCASCYGGMVDNSTDRFAVPREPVSTWYKSPYHFGFEILARIIKRQDGLPIDETRNWGQ